MLSQNWVVLNDRHKTLWALYANDIDERELTEKEDMVDGDYFSVGEYFRTGISSCQAPLTDLT